MTRDEIIKLAREANLYVGTNISGVTLVGAAKSNGLLIHMTINDLERFATLVAAAEREECANVCDAASKPRRGYGQTDEQWAASTLAERIRTRNKE